MTQAFNPFTPNTVQAPAPIVQAHVQPPVANPAQVQATLGSLDSPVQGFGAPLFPQQGCDGQYRIQVVGYAGGVGYESGPAIHITFKIVTSSNASFTPGQEFRLFYKYDWQLNRPVPGKQGSVHRDLLIFFICALFKRAHNDPSFSKLEAHNSLMQHDFTSQPGFVDLHCQCRDWQKTPQSPVEKKRRETWVAIPG